MTPAQLVLEYILILLLAAIVLGIITLLLLLGIMVIQFAYEVFYKVRGNYGKF